MNNLNIRGVILPDSYWLDDNVATLSAFQQEIGQIEDSIDLYIDSCGGDVMTSNSMSALIAEWCMAHPNAKCKCTIGGLCASAAANIVAKLPACFTVSCHPDTLAMYHSCYGFVEGGPDALRDNAVLMDLVNSIVIKNLLQKTNLDEERVRTAFKEGREMWLDGEELVACGLADNLLDGNAEKIELKVSNDRQGTEAMRYVACVCRNINAKLEAHIKMENEENKVTAEETPQVTAETTTEAVAEVKAECEEEEKKTATAECGEKETKAETEEEEPKAEETTEEEPKAEEENEEVKALRAENAELKAKIENLEAIVAKYSPSAKPEQTVEKKDFRQLMKEIPSNLSQNEYAKRFTALKQQYKAEYDEFMASRQNRG